ncbi:MAG: HXXEE domain-containing protein [Myxococcota bacterium]
MEEVILYGWPYLGLVIMFALFAYLVLEPRVGLRRADPSFVLPMVWPMYLLHQFEEHGIDALGRKFAFLDSLCATLGFDLGTCPGDASFIFAVNAVACWLCFALALIYRRRRPLVAACAWGIPFVNFFAHVGPALATQSYNPGLVTTVLLFVPISTWMMRVTVASKQLRPLEMGWVLLCGLLIHIVLIASLQLRAQGLISESVLLIANGLNGLWPLVIGLMAEGVRGMSARSSSSA